MTVLSLVIVTQPGAAAVYRLAVGAGQLRHQGLRLQTICKPTANMCENHLHTGFTPLPRA